MVDGWASIPLSGAKCIRMHATHLPDVALDGFAGACGSLSIRCQDRASHEKQTILTNRIALYTVSIELTIITITYKTLGYKIMEHARLTGITIENFKSYRDRTEIPLAPLTIVVGPNNSGKSSLIQTLLLLKQTLNDPNDHIPLRLDGVVNAFNLRELTHDWPERNDHKPIPGPVLTLAWNSRVDAGKALAIARNPNRTHLAINSGVEWLRDIAPDDRFDVQASLAIHLEEFANSIRFSSLEVTIRVPEHSDAPVHLKILTQKTPFVAVWQDQPARRIAVELDHFIPYLRINRDNVGPQLIERTWHNAYLILMAQPLEDLKRLIKDLHYLGSNRATSNHPLFMPSTTDPIEIGSQGEFAAPMLHRQQTGNIHFLPSLEIPEDASRIQPPTEVRVDSLLGAMNTVMRSLSIQAELSIHDLGVGFQVLFGKASLPHVGRGLGYLLPLVQIGLFADPLRFTGETGSMPLEAYQKQCDTVGHIAIEEPEAHLHPKVASRLAHFFVSQAMARRQFIIETHSDHLVRRLRGLIARAEPGSPLENWLLKNVVILNVSRVSGCSSVEVTRLTRDGSIGDYWPEDFMDESSNEESAIYYAKLDKEERFTHDPSGIRMNAGKEPEAEAVP